MQSNTTGQRTLVRAVKRTLYALGAVAALTVTPALAADLPLKAPPPPPPVLGWTGCYIGGNVGVGLASSQWSDTTSEPVAFSASDFLGAEYPITNSYSGTIGGGQVGCNYQFSHNWVVGIEGMYDGASLNGNVSDPNMFSRTPPALPSIAPFGPSNGLLNVSQNWLASLTGRLGYTSDALMVYAKGGVAWTSYNYHVANSCVVFPLCSTALAAAQLGEGLNFDASRDAVGGTGGFGLEWHFAPNVTAFVEYDYYGFGSSNVNFALTGCGTDVILCPIALTKQAHIDDSVQTVKLGVNVLWNWGCCGYIVAKD